MIYKLAYLFFLAIIIYWEHRIFGERWKSFEYARRSMGIITVMFFMFVLILIDMYVPIFDNHFDVWLWTFAGFCLSGVVLVAMDTDKAAVHNSNFVRNLQKEIESIDEASNQ